MQNKWLDILAQSEPPFPTQNEPLIPTQSEPH